MTYKVCFIVVITIALLSSQSYADDTNVSSTNSPKSDDKSSNLPPIKVRCGGSALRYPWLSGGGMSGLGGGGGLNNAGYSNSLSQMQQMMLQLQQQVSTLTQLMTAQAQGLGGAGMGQRPFGQNTGRLPMSKIFVKFKVIY